MNLAKKAEFDYKYCNKTDFISAVEISLLEPINSTLGYEGVVNLKYFEL